MDNRIDGVVLSVVSELGNIPASRMEQDGRMAVSAPAPLKKARKATPWRNDDVSEHFEPRLTGNSLLLPSGNPPTLEAFYIIMLQQRRVAMKEIGSATPPRDPPAATSERLRLETALRRSEKLAMAGTARGFGDARDQQSFTGDR